MEVIGRHEHKLSINELDYCQLKARLVHLTTLDAHSSGQGGYKIRSLYFDNYMDKAVTEKLSGQSRREKFRIRFYEDDPTFIRLEKKAKSNRLCYKSQVQISQDECQALLEGDRDFLKDESRPLFMELYLKMKEENLRPRVIVDYWREAYLFPAGNVRITFDRDVRASQHVQGFFDPDLLTIPAARALILEIKYDGFLPDVIRQALQIGSRNESEFSKYLVSRLV